MQHISRSGRLRKIGSRLASVRTHKLTKNSDDDFEPRTDLNQQWRHSGRTDRTVKAYDRPYPVLNREKPTIAAAAIWYSELPWGERLVHALP
jgi:hypothetical protein